MFAVLRVCKSFVLIFRACLKRDLVTGYGRLCFSLWCEIWIPNWILSMLLLIIWNIFYGRVFSLQMCIMTIGMKIIIEPDHEIMALFVLCKLILQTRMCSHPVGLDVWYLVGPLSTSILHVSEQRRLWHVLSCAGSIMNLCNIWSFEIFLSNNRAEQKKVSGGQCTGS